MIVFLKKMIKFDGLFLLEGIWGGLNAMSKCGFLALMVNTLHKWLFLRQQEVNESEKCET